MTVLTTYALHASARCPKDGNRYDSYDILIEAHGMIEVEEIIGFFDHYKNKPIFQEKLTIEAAKKFEAKVTSVGHHTGVRTVCIADAMKDVREQ